MRSYRWSIILPALCAMAPLHRAAAQGVATAKVDTTVIIRAEGPELAFIPSELALKQGLRVRLRFVNEGTMAHNFVLVRNENDIDMLSDAAADAEKTGHVPLQHGAKMIAYTALAATGKTVEVTFVVPPPGTYIYVCLFPGHANTMLGSLRSLK